MAIDTETTPYPPLEAKIRLGEKDHSISHEERAFFSFPRTKDSIDEPIVLHDIRSPEAASASLQSGATGLDTQGFTYVHHESAMQASLPTATQDEIRDVYVPEVEKLVRELTGAKRAVVNNIGIRRWLAADQEDRSFYLKRGGEFDRMIGAFPRNVPLISSNKPAESVEPTRLARIDYTLQGLRDSARYCRNDIKDAAREALEAEDSLGLTSHVPRYAAFSVWRPITTVHRDPLSVADWLTIRPQKDMETMRYRAPSGTEANGEYVMEAWSLLPRDAEARERQKWDWMKEQTVDDVLVIKFADTLSAFDERVAAGCPHAAAIWAEEGVMERVPRESIEARVLAFW